MIPYTAQDITSGVIFKDFKSKLYYLRFKTTQHTAIYKRGNNDSKRRSFRLSVSLLKNNKCGGALTVTWRKFKAYSESSCVGTVVVPKTGALLQDALHQWGTDRTWQQPCLLLLVYKYCPVIGGYICWVCCHSKVRNLVHVCCFGTFIKLANTASQEQQTGAYGSKVFCYLCISYGVKVWNFFQI